MANTALRVITSRAGKYVIIAFWVAMVVIAAPLAGKLTDVEKNEAKSWLPGTAESTRALEAQSAFASPNSLPAVVVYERPSGLTPADQQKIAADAAQYGQIGDLDGKVVGPISAADGTAAQVIVPLDLGDEGWNRAGTIVCLLYTSPSPRDRQKSRMPSSA